MAESTGFKLDKGFWISTAVSLGILLLGLFLYDTIKTRMVSKSASGGGEVMDMADAAAEEVVEDAA